MAPVRFTYLADTNYKSKVLSYETIQFCCYKMPKIISYTPSWLSRPSPGFQLFSRQSPERGVQKGPTQFENNLGGEKKHSGHQRTIARRGTEVFVVVNNEIRWSDLCMLREDWEEQEQGNRRRRRQVEREEIENNNGSYRASRIS